MPADTKVSDDRLREWLEFCDHAAKHGTRPSLPVEEQRAAITELIALRASLRAAAAPATLKGDAMLGTDLARGRMDDV